MGSALFNAVLRGVKILLNTKDNYHDEQHYDCSTHILTDKDLL